MKTLFAIILFAGCALAQDEALIPQVRAACGPDNIKFDADINEAADTAPSTEQGKARVYVIGQSMTGNILARIGLDGKWTGALRTPSYISFPVDPGEHRLCANWQSVFGSLKKTVALSHFTAEPGKAYYFRLRFFAAENGDRYLDLDPLDADEGQFLAASSPLSEFHLKRHQ